MKSFKLYVYKNDVYRILITQQNNIAPTEQTTLYSTFDEHIEYAENDQLSLTFSMMKWVDRVMYENTHINQPILSKRTENQFCKLLQIGSKLELELDNKEKYIFIIKNIKPNIKKDNIKYDFTCQDEVSYSWSRRNLGMSYSTVEKGGVRTIQKIAQDVLEDAHISGWTIKTDEIVADKRITFEVEDSNPYNIIIEACNAINANMKVNYTLHQISFYSKDRVPFSGYRYRPETNLKTFDVDYSGEEFATIMHVIGGTDENDMIVSMVPPIPDTMINYFLGLADKNVLNIWEGYTPTTDEEKQFLTVAEKIPHLGQFICDFSFFENNKLLSAEQHNKLKEFFNIKMRNNNIYLKKYEPNYYRAYSYLYQYIQELKTAIEISKVEPSKKYDDKVNIMREPLCGLYNRNQIDMSNAWTIDNNTLSLQLGTLSTLELDNTDYTLFSVDLLQQIADEAVRYGKKMWEATNKKDMQMPSGLDEYEQTLFNADLSYYKSQYDTLLTIVGKVSESGFMDFKDEDGNLSVYGLLLKIIYEELYKNTYTTTLYNEILRYRNNNIVLWSQIYAEFSQFIYEAKYQDDSELDSISLFNKATSYYEDYKRPKANYSMAVLDLSVLDVIDIPRLSVGSKIKVYNNELNLTDSNNTDEDALCDIQYTNNDLIVSTISYNLRNSADVSVGVQQLNSYATILQKLIKTIE